MITPSHPSFPYLRDKMRDVARKKRVIDMGTPRSFHKEMSFFRDLFHDNYRSMGYLLNENLETDLKGDIMALDMPDRSLDAIICLGVFPSITDPHQAVNEIYRVLEPGGLFLGTFPFLTGYYAVIEGKDPYPDYWRFTREGLKMLFSQFKNLEIRAIDGGATVRFKFLPTAFNGLTYRRWFMRILAFLDRKIASSATTGYILFGKK